MAIKIKGTRVSVFTSNTIGNCSNNGVSAKQNDFILTGGKFDEVGRVYEIDDNEVYLKLVTKNFAGKNYQSAVPVFPAGVKPPSGPMFGGTFVYTSGSPFFEVCTAPVALHDRFE